MAGQVKHQKVLAQADDADANSVSPTDWNAPLVLSGGSTGQFLRRNSAQSPEGMDVAWPEDLYLPSATMLNNSGGAVVAGDVVVLDSAANNAFKKIASAGSLLPVFIVQENINNGATGRVKQVGYAAVVAVNGAVSRGNYLMTDATGGLAKDAGANVIDGVFAAAFTGFGGPGTGAVAALLFGSTVQIKAVGGRSVKGLIVDWASSTTLDVSADEFDLADATGKLMVKYNTGVLTLNISNSGLLGRDQTGAFSASSFFHVYGIGRLDTGVVSVVASVNAPPTGPDLNTIAALQPYDHWCYLGAYRLDSGTLILRGSQKGDLWEYEPEQNILDDGTATTETAVPTSAFVPPNALSVKLHVNAAGSTAAQATSLKIRIHTGIEYRTFQVRTATTLDGPGIEVPNIAQNVSLWSSSRSSR